MYNDCIVRFALNGHNMQITVAAISYIDAIITVERMFPGANVLSAVLK